MRRERKLGRRKKDTSPLSLCRALGTFVRDGNGGRKNV